MHKDGTSIQGSILRVVALFGLLLLAPCGKNEALSAQAGTAHALPSLPDDPPPASENLSLPLKFERHTNDLDEMLKRRTIRALVVIDPIGFFYVGGLPGGAMYEALQAFQSFINRKLKTGATKVEVSFLPVSIGQIEAALEEGMGDIIATLVTITPERQRRVAFSTPIWRDVTQIIVTAPEYGAVSTFEALGGKEVYVNPLTVYYENLQKVNASLKKSGKAPIVIKAADRNLSNDDLIQMVNAGLIPATVTGSVRALLWSRVLHGIKPHPELSIASGAQLAWVMRKNNPRFKQLVDEFVRTHAMGTSFGDTVFWRYWENTTWVTNSTSKPEMEKFRALLAIFQKYAAQYDFDHLMLAAQGYQESRLNQDVKSPGAAVGIMQVLPKDAAASPINIANVSNAEGNIHAAAKMLRNIADTYFNDPKVDTFNRALFVLASYNAGPNRVARLREQAKE
ncbi:MAG TPA: lytic transglycosylase F [Blastocatellia bacterium]|nr:lytic transglycosylase F [Blastocatellia bacterium]